MKNPRRDLPLVINGSMIVVIIGFMLMNAALYVCLPMNVMRTSSTVAVVSIASEPDEDVYEANSRIGVRE